MVQLHHALGEASVPAGPGRGAGCCRSTAVRRPLGGELKLLEGEIDRQFMILRQDLA